MIQIYEPKADIWAHREQVFRSLKQRSERKEYVAHSNHAREAEKINCIKVTFHGAGHCLQSKVPRKVSAHIIVELSETGL